MAKETRETLEKRLPSELIQLVLDMYDGRKETKEIVNVVKSIFPDSSFTYRDIPRILKVYRGDTLTAGNQGGKALIIRFDKDIAEFLESLPIPASDFVNAIMGIYIREYKLKKSQQENNE